MMGACRVGLPKIVGKTIEDVVVKTGKDPAGQLYLLFEDGTYYEVYTDGFIGGCKRVNRGDLDYVKQHMARQDIAFVASEAQSHSQPPLPWPTKTDPDATKAARTDDGSTTQAAGLTVRLRSMSQNITLPLCLLVIVIAVYSFDRYWPAPQNLIQML